MLSFVLSLFFELTQLSGLYFIYSGSYRLFDMDDLLLNTLGGLVGYALAGPIARMLPSREALDQISLARGRQVSLLRRMLALFYDTVISLRQPQRSLQAGARSSGQSPRISACFRRCCRVERRAWCGRGCACAARAAAFPISISIPFDLGWSLRR